MIKDSITGIVLAGGKSSRMGTDKGIIDLNGKRIVQHVLDALAPVVDKILIIANNNHYNNFGYPVYRDIIKDSGPLGGIYTGLVNSNTEKNIVLSCDIPFITTQMINYIVAQSGEYEITIPMHDGKQEPLCGTYSKKCASRFKKLLENKIWKMHEVLTLFATQQLGISSTNGVEQNFVNINTPQDLTIQMLK